MLVAEYWRLKTMATSFEQVNQYLIDIGIGVEEADEEKGQFRFFVHPQNLRLNCYVNLRNGGNYLNITCYPQTSAAGPLGAVRREQLLERINKFNLDYSYGRWSLDHEDDPRVTFTIFLSDAELTRRQLWSVIFIIKDLVITQAQCLQLLISCGIDERCNEVLLSGVALNAAINNPSKVGDVCKALCLSHSASRTLFDVVGQVYVEEDERVEVIEHEPEEAQGALLN